MAFLDSTIATGSSTLPAGTLPNVSGSNVLIIAAFQIDDDLSSAPTGYTPVPDGAVAENTLLELFYRISDGDDPAPDGVTDTNVDWVVIVATWDGVDTADPFADVASATTAFGSQAQATVTATAGDFLAVFSGIDAFNSPPGTVSWTADAEVTEAEDAGATFRVLALGQGIAEASDDYTLGGSWDAFNAVRTIALALRPAPAGGGAALITASGQRLITQAGAHLTT